MRPTSPAEEKALAAEKRIAIVRLSVIVFNVGAYYLLLEPGVGVPWLALLVSVAALSYALFVVVFRPYRWWPILRAALFTALTDGVLIALWVGATGGVHSPFHLLWLLSMMAVAFRYEARATVVATALYIASFVALVWLQGALVPNAVDVMIRSTYILLAGVLGALLAHDSAMVFEAQARTNREIALQRRLQEDQELGRLRELDRFKTQFINAAAHELNTPLTPLKLQVHILQRPGFLNDEAARQRAVRILGNNVERLAGLVQEMLEVARMQSHEVQLNRVRVDLAALVRETVETYAGPAAERHIKINVRGPDSLVALVDGKRVSQILYNLVSNAVKYSMDDGVVDVRYWRDVNSVTLEVEDRGHGFTPQQRALMFRPFSQAHRDLVQAAGTGLGLFISRSIAERHGGTLDASSPGPGHGATFTCVLPLEPQPSRSDRS